jgi:hypothetical protein
LVAAIFVIKEIMLLLWSFLLYSWVQVLVRVGSPEVVPSERVRALGCSQTSGESVDSTGTWPPVTTVFFMGMWEHLRIFPLGIRPEGSSAGGDPSMYTEK